MTSTSAPADSAGSGQLHLPGSGEYDRSRSGYNLLVPHHPAAVAVPTTVADVVAAVDDARQRGLPVAIQATGHGPTVAADGAVLINTRAMQGVHIDPRRGTATFEAGVRSGAIVRAAADHGLAPVNGSSPEVGAVAYHLGQGLGILSRQFGYAAEYVESADVVTADGMVHHASPDQDADLFWALLHGKGNFGVVVSMTIRLVPVARLYGGGIWFGEDDIEALLSTWAEWVLDIPDEMSTSALLIDLPDFEGIPDPIRGRRILHLRVAFTGTADEGEALIAPLRSTGTPLLDTVGEMSYRDVGTIHSEPTQPVAFLADHTVLGTIDGEVLRTLLDHAHAAAPAPYMVELRLLGGAMARGERANADSLFTCYVGGAVTPETENAVHSSEQALLDALAPWSTGAVCENLLAGPHATADRVWAARDPRELDRLRALKARFDPENTFRVNLNLRP